MRQLLKIFLLLSIVFSLTACNRMVALNSNPPKLPQTARALSHKPLKVAAVSDQRDEYEPNMLIHFDSTAGNQSHYGFFAREAIGKTFGDTLRATLQQQGYRVSSKSQRLLLETHLQYLHMRWLPGILPTGLLGNMRIYFRLERERDGRVIWSDTYVARAQDNKHRPWATAQAVYQQMSDSIIKQLLTSPGFRHAVQTG